MLTSHKKINISKISRDSILATTIQTGWRCYIRKKHMESVADLSYVKWILNPDGQEDPIMEMLTCERQKRGQKRGQRRYSLRQAIFKKNVSM